MREQVRIRDRLNHMGEQPFCYFDNNATTQVAPEVLETMIPFLRDHWGNPSSVYWFGKQTARHIEHAREQVAALINADPREIIFTSCGTESNNSAIHSALVTSSAKASCSDNCRGAFRKH